MTNTSSNGEVFGTTTLYAAMVVGAVALLLGSLWTPAALSPATAQPATSAPQMVVTSAAPGYVS
jgi:hypothetical protein